MVCVCGVGGCREKEKKEEEEEKEKGKEKGKEKRFPVVILATENMALVLQFHRQIVLVSLRIPDTPGH